jgi:hypothetical protein
MLALGVRWEEGVWVIGKQLNYMDMKTNFWRNEFCESWAGYPLTAGALPTLGWLFPFGAKGVCTLQPLASPHGWARVFVQRWLVLLASL